MRRFAASIRIRLLSAFAVTLISACGGGGGGGGGSDSISTPSTPTGDNVQTISVNGGSIGIPNLAYTSVTVCVPGTTQCQVIDNVMIDTGSVGLRLLPSALGSLALPQQTTASGDPLFECVEFVDLSHMWGPVRLADIKIAGLQALSVPVQTVGDVGAHSEPASCGGGDSTENLSSVATLGGNGILGLGLFQEDCGLYCSLYLANQHYFSCPAAGCNETTVENSRQLTNPVSRFATDNNGVIMQLPSVASGGAVSANGWMIFGIGTRDNNALGSAKIHTVDIRGYVSTTYKNTVYPRSFIDSGSNGLFFPDSTIPICNSSDVFFCPSSTLHLSGVITGENSASSTISFNVANTESLNGNLNAFNNLAGYYGGGFDWGMPFFFGRKVFTAIDGMPGIADPYVAF